MKLRGTLLAVLFVYNPTVKCQMSNVNLYSALSSKPLMRWTHCLVCVKLQSISGHPVTDVSNAVFK